MSIPQKLNTHTDNRDEVMAMSREALPAHIVAYIEECNAGPEPKSRLIGVLHKVQDHFGYLGAEQLDAVAQLMQVPAAKVTGVATFYHYFRLTPRGRFVINVCLGTACYVKGVERVTDKLKEELGIDFGETTSDGLFSLEPARCLGTCAMAPVIMVGRRIHGDMTADKVPALLEHYTKLARKEDEGPEAPDDADKG
jgi:NADH:ubiquinone oxidoreductase subunit E